MGLTFRGLMQIFPTSTFPPSGGDSDRVLTFASVNLSGVNLSNSNLQGAQFNAQTIFSDGTNGANLSGTNAVIGSLNGQVDLRGVNLDGVNLSGSGLAQAQFSNTTVFSDGTGDGVNLSGTGAMISTLTGQVDLRGVNLAGVNLVGSTLDQAQFNAQTIFSDGLMGLIFRAPMQIFPISTFPPSGGDSDRVLTFVVSTFRGSIFPIPTSRALNLMHRLFSRTAPTERTFQELMQPLTP
jgi:hypothetical protein